MVSQSFSRFENSDILVTGGCGFIGSHLVERLVALGGRVTVLDNLQAGRWANLSEVRALVSCLQGDVRDSGPLLRLIGELQPRFIFHLAANASVPGSVQEPAYDFETNAAGTFHLLNAVRLLGDTSPCEKVVVASSGAVYGEPISFPITETDLIRPISPYGASKQATEVQAQMFERVYKQPVVIARLFNTYGPRMARFVILDFLRKLQRNPGQLEILGTGKQVRDFTYVGDTVQGLMTLAIAGTPGEAYNISSGTNCSVTDLAHAMIETLGLTGKTEISYTGKSWVGDAQRWEVAIDKIRSLGYSPQFTLSKGLEETICWFVGTGGPIV